MVFLIFKQRYRGPQRSRFALETQESQWSPKLSLNSFQPIDSDIKGKSINFTNDFEAEPEIVTAGPLEEVSVKNSLIGRA